MPCLNGFGFLQAYAQRPPTDNAAVVVVMLTTSLAPTDVEQKQDLPINGYLTKLLTTNQALRKHPDYAGAYRLNALQHSETSQPLALLVLPYTSSSSQSLGPGRCQHTHNGTSSPPCSVALSSAAWFAQGCQGLCRK